MAFAQRRSCRAFVPIVALLVVVCVRSAVNAFVGPAHAQKALRTSTTQRQVDIFGGFNFPQSDGPDLSKEDAGDDPRTRRAANEAEGTRIVEVNMPLGIEFEEKGEGDIYIKSVDSSSDAFQQGVRPGAQLVMVSATFGDDMWSARGVGITQLTTVIQSRFGSTMKLALENENKSFLDDFFGAFKSKTPADTEEAKKKQQNMLSEFEKEEERLKDKSMWNPFR